MQFVQLMFWFSHGYKPNQSSGPAGFCLINSTKHCTATSNEFTVLKLVINAEWVLWNGMWCANRNDSGNCFHADQMTTNIHTVSHFSYFRYLYFSAISCDLFTHSLFRTLSLTFIHRACHERKDICNISIALNDLKHLTNILHFTHILSIYAEYKMLVASLSLYLLRFLLVFNCRQRILWCVNWMPFLSTAYPIWNDRNESKRTNQINLNLSKYDYLYRERCVEVELSWVELKWMCELLTDTQLSRFICIFFSLSFFFVVNSCTCVRLFLCVCFMPLVYRD